MVGRTKNKGLVSTMKQSKSKIKGIIEAKKSNRKKNGWAEISYIDNKTGERVTAEKGNLVNFKIGTDIVYRTMGGGVQHYGKVVDGGNKTKYMIRFHGNLTELVPRSKVFGWR